LCLIFFFFKIKDGMPYQQNKAKGCISSHTASAMRK